MVLVQKIVFKIKRKIIHIIFPLICKALIFCQFYNLLAYLIVQIIKISTNNFESIYNSNGLVKSQVNILVFMRGLFDKDIVEMHRKTDLKLYIFPNEYYTMLADAVLPKHLRHQLTYHHHSSNKNFQSIELNNAMNDINYNINKDKIAKSKFESIVYKLLNYMEEKLCLHSMITSNINYYQDQAWQKAFYKKKIKIFVLYKEFYGNKYARKQAIIMDKELGIQNMVDAIFVFCNWAKEILIESGMAKGNNIIVTGSPRTDLIYDTFSARQNRKNLDDRLVVLFDFFETKEYSLFIDTIKIFSKMALSNKNPNIKFIIKTKYDLFSKNIQEFCQKHNITLNGIIISSNIDQKYILENTNCFIGFRTSALVEYMHTDIPILNLNWAEAEKDTDRNMFNEENVAYEMIRSPNDLKISIESIINNTMILPDGFKEERKKIIEKFLYRIDGKRSISIANKIINAQAVVK